MKSLYTRKHAFNAMDKKLKLSRPLPYITYIYCYLVGIDAMAGAEMLYEARAIYEADENLIDKEQILGEITLAESFLQFNDAPLMNQYQKAISTALGTVEIQIPEGTIASGPGGWDGTFKLPTISSQPSVNINGARHYASAACFMFYSRWI